jgi:hypothetical protein
LVLLRHSKRNARQSIIKKQILNCFVRKTVTDKVLWFLSPVVVTDLVTFKSKAAIVAAAAKARFVHSLAIQNPPDRPDSLRCLVPAPCLALLPFRQFNFTLPVTVPFRWRNVKSDSFINKINATHTYRRKH